VPLRWASGRLARLKPRHAFLPRSVFSFVDLVRPRAFGWAITEK
jgi:hypothetical protein